MSDEEFDREQKPDNNKNNPEKIAVENIMRSEINRNFIWDHLQACGVHESVFHVDPIQNAFNSGVRESALRLERKLKEYAPDQYATMIKDSL